MWHYHASIWSCLLICCWLRSQTAVLCSFVWHGPVAYTDRCLSWCKCTDGEWIPDGAGQRLGIAASMPVSAAAVSATSVVRWLHNVPPAVAVSIPWALSVQLGDENTCQASLGVLLHWIVGRSRQQLTTTTTTHFTALYPS